MNTVEGLKFDFVMLQNFINEMNQTNSDTDKLAVLQSWKNNRFVEQVLEYTYNPFKNYYVTSENCLKRNDLSIDNYSILFVLLDDLSSRKISGHQAISYVNGFAATYGDIIYKIIDRNLEIRVYVKTINKVFTNLIPVYSVALAETLDEKTKKKVDFKKDRWYGSRKLDGIRCQVVIDEYGTVLGPFSRSGNEFKTLNLLKQEFEGKGFKNLVFDGEVCVITEDNEDDFQGIAKQIMRKDYDIENYRYYIFDLIDINTFNGKTRGFDFSIRIERLNKLLDEVKLSDRIVALKQNLLSSEEEFEALKEVSREKNWEGLILRKDCEYKNRRSFDILKVKEFVDCDVLCKSIEIGDFRVINENKIEVIEKTMTNIIIDYKGNEVSVGSGFSLQQRRDIYRNPEIIVNKMINIKFFEESMNQKDNSISLRFPIFKYIYGKTREF